ALAGKWRVVVGDTAHRAALCIVAAKRPACAASALGGRAAVDVGIRRQTGPAGRIVSAHHRSLASRVDDELSPRVKPRVEGPDARTAFIAHAAAREDAEGDPFTRVEAPLAERGRPGIAF